MKRYYYALNFALLVICSSHSFAALSDKKKTSVSSEINEIHVVKKSSLAPEAKRILALYTTTNAAIEKDFIKILLSRLNTLLKEKKAPLKIAQTKNNASAFTLFHAAVLHKMSTLVKKLIHHKIVNTHVNGWKPTFQRKPLDNITALHIAAYQADLPTAKIILSMKNARQNPTNSIGETPLHMLTRILPPLTDTSELTKYMIRKGCCLDRKNLDEQTPPNMAVNRSAQSAFIMNQATCACNTCKKKTHSESRKNRNRKQQKIIRNSSTSSDNNACSSSTSRKK